MKNKKKAVVVGGSNGVGRATVYQLIQEDYFVYILDVVSPDMLSDIERQQSEYCYCNLLDFNEHLFGRLSEDKLVDTLVITAGFGQISAFSDTHISQIEKVLRINTVSTLKILKVFYHRICGENSFYSLVMGSIAGNISSPLFSLYAASKAGINRFIESVNIELECDGCFNRILNVSPGAINGTHFYENRNDLLSLYPLVRIMLQQMRSRNALYIPEYEPIYRNVLNQYHQDPHAFGINSYYYKINSGRPILKKTGVVGYLSGTFDLFHVGHLNLLKRAKENCDYLIVGVHPDASHKKKETFVSFSERKEIVESIKYVDKVVNSCPEDSDAWTMFAYNKLFVGSDYKGTARFLQYEKFFLDKEVEVVYLPYTTGTSSTQLRLAINLKLNTVQPIQ